MSTSASTYDKFLGIKKQDDACHNCHQNVNYLSFADNPVTICHLGASGTQIALRISEVRVSDEGNARSLRTTEELQKI